MLYEFCLDDYSAPSCTSGYKYYYGSEEDLMGILNNIEEGKHIKEEDVFKDFCNGNKDVENAAGFCMVRFAKPVCVLKERKINKGETQYDYENPYECHYLLRMDSVTSKRILLKCEDRYVIAHKSIMINPKYKDDLFPNGWATLGMLWGFPGMIKVSGDDDYYTAENMLYVVERTFDNETEATAYFDSESDIDFQMFFEDVFGDG